MKFIIAVDWKSRARLSATLLVINENRTVSEFTQIVSGPMIAPRLETLEKGLILSRKSIKAIRNLSREALVEMSLPRRATSFAAAVLSVPVPIADNILGHASFTKRLIPTGWRASPLQ